MKYKIGMFGGSFDPLHIGHVNDIIMAASQCEQLYIVLCHSSKRDSIPMEIRFRWIKNIFQHMQNIHMILLEDAAKSKEEYDKQHYWEAGRDYVLSQIGQKVDVVFCGSDYSGTGRYEDLYRCDVIYFDRSIVPISSTEIRKHPLKYWSYIPNECKRYFVKRVLFVGGESTGKSTLSTNLALYYNTNCLEEVGREVCDYAGTEDLMIPEDFHEILLKHKLKEQELLKTSNRILFEDTDAVITKFFARFLLADASEKEKIDHLADAIIAINRFDLVFFLEPTVAFVQDGTRNVKIEEDREFYSEQIKALLDEANIKYHCLTGDYLERFETAKRIIEKTFDFRCLVC